MSNFTDAELLAYLSTCCREKRTEIALPLPPDMVKRLTDNQGKELFRLLIRAGYDPYARFTSDGIFLRIHQLFCSQEPLYPIQTQRELTETLEILARQNTQHFRFLMPEQLLSQLMSNNGQKLKESEGAAGILTSSYTVYQEIGLIVYSSLSAYELRRRREAIGNPGKKNGSFSASFRTIDPPGRKTVQMASGTKMKTPKQTVKVPELLTEEKKTASKTPAGTNRGTDIPYFGSMSQIIAFTEKQAEELRETIEFICPLPVIRELQEGILKNDGNIMPRYQGLTNHAGISSSGMMWWNDGKFRIDNIQYYPGFRILRMVEKGKESLLLGKDRKTLASAREILKRIGTDNPGDTILAISIEIGRETTYTIDETTKDDDCAYGPLLNGKANCDGYADAFYLCAGLAGLKVRYQHGCSNKEEHKTDKYEDQTHLWNLVCLRNGWTMLDVTWDKNSSGTPAEYVHCMIGLDRAEKIYRWNRDMSPEIMPRTDFSRAPSMHEYLCSTRKEAESSAKQAVRQNQKEFYLYCQGKGVVDSDSDLVNLMRIAGCRHSYSYRRIQEFNGWKIML